MHPLQRIPSFTLSSIQIYVKTHEFLSGSPLTFHIPRNDRNYSQQNSSTFFQISIADSRSSNWFYSHKRTKKISPFSLFIIKRETCRSDIKDPSSTVLLWFFFRFLSVFRIGHCCAWLISRSIFSEVIETRIVIIFLLILISTFFFFSFLSWVSKIYGKNGKCIKLTDCSVRAWHEK